MQINCKIKIKLLIIINNNNNRNYLKRKNSMKVINKIMTNLNNQEMR